MSALVGYQSDGTVATLRMDDGKANAIGFEMIAALHDALDRAERDEVAVVLVGRDGRFSGGFDLKVLTRYDAASADLLRAGLELAWRVQGFPYPVVVACSGHTYAMALFLALSADFRIGVAGADHRITANEVKIGMTMPRAAIELCRGRLAPTSIERVVVHAEVFSPQAAHAAGILDALSPGADTLLADARAKAANLMELDRRAFRATKARLRAPLLDALAAAIEADQAELRALL